MASANWDVAPRGWLHIDRHRKTLVAHWHVAIPLLIAFFFHLYNLGYSEYSNDESIAVTYSVYMAHGVDNPLLFGSLFIYPHPPVRVLVNLPFIWLFGTSEAIVRLPHALFGALTVLPLYFAAETLFNRRVAVLAGLLYAIGGVSAINQECQGVGIYIFFVVLALWALARFWKSTQPRAENRYLLLASVSLIVASYTYLEAAIFVFPALLFVLYKKGIRETMRMRGVWGAAGLMVAALALYFGIWYLLPQVAGRMGYINTIGAGNMQHIAQRAGGLLAFNLSEISAQYAAYNSLFGALLLAIGLVAGIVLLRHHRAFWLSLVYPLPHLLAWTFLLENIVMHPMYDYPLLVIPAAAGLVAIDNELRLRQTARRLLAGTLVLLCMLTAWHHFITHNQDTIPAVAQRGILGPMANRPIRQGAKAAGYYVRAHSDDVNEQVAAFGTGSAHFYAGRMDKSHAVRQLVQSAETLDAAELAAFIAESPQRAEQWDQVAYIITTDAYPALWDYATERYALAAIVTVREQPSLYVFDTGQVPHGQPPDLLATETINPRYDRQFSGWRVAVPWFSTQVQNRL